MRFLHLDDADKFSLVEIQGSNLPDYAILSHTWGLERQEVTYQNFVNDTGKEKEGHRKLRFLAKQAAKDGLRYFWIDTCCINKESSSEQTESINSMYRWYKNSRKCYVYLSDMPGNLDDESGQQAFRKCRWFTRSWTLQELLAPDHVEFFAVDGTNLGDKRELCTEINKITGIPLAVLQGSKSPIVDCTIHERIEWAYNRDATREEDRAYALQGIFDVHMLPIYGEGLENAISRLIREIELRQETKLTGPFEGLLKKSKDPTMNSSNNSSNNFSCNNWNILRNKNLNNFSNNSSNQPSNDSSLNLSNYYLSGNWNILQFKNLNKSLINTSSNSSNDCPTNYGNSSQKDYSNNFSDNSSDNTLKNYSDNTFKKYWKDPSRDFWRTSLNNYLDDPSKYYRTGGLNNHLSKSTKRFWNSTLNNYLNSTSKYSSKDSSTKSLESYLKDSSKYSGVNLPDNHSHKFWNNFLQNYLKTSSTNFSNNYLNKSLKYLSKSTFKILFRKF